MTTTWLRQGFKRVLNGTKWVSGIISILKVIQMGHWAVGVLVTAVKGYLRANASLMAHSIRFSCMSDTLFSGWTNFIPYSSLMVDSPVQLAGLMVKCQPGD